MSTSTPLETRVTAMETLKNSGISYAKLHVLALLVYNIGLHVGSISVDESGYPWKTSIYWRYAISCTWIIPLYFSATLWINRDKRVWISRDKRGFYAIHSSVMIVYMLSGMLHIAVMIINFVDGKLHPTGMSYISFWMVFFSLMMFVYCAISWLLLNIKLKELLFQEHGGVEKNKTEIKAT